MILALVIVWAVGALAWSYLTRYAIVNHATPELTDLVKNHPTATNVVLVLSAVLWPLSLAFNLISLAVQGIRA